MPFIQSWGFKTCPFQSHVFEGCCPPQAIPGDRGVSLKPDRPETLWGHRLVSTRASASWAWRSLPRLTFHEEGSFLECVTPSREKLWILSLLCEAAGFYDLRAVTLTAGMSSFPKGQGQAAFLKQRIAVLKQTINTYTQMVKLKYWSHSKQMTIQYPGLVDRMLERGSPRSDSHGGEGVFRGEGPWAAGGD